ncbi:LOW QUALITY PROTEIN: oxidoreductase [Geomicrobium sp. JCM 19038]|nr:LOW QUALITY PROTEIN: oxidoreductase [Geomicrobium sp. JCM 19038]
MSKIAVVSFGLGPIGVEILKKCSLEEHIEVVGGVDVDPQKLELPLSELVSEAPTNRHIHDNISKLQHIVSAYEHKVAVHATGSHLPSVWPQIKELLDHGFHVVSTCEELLYPWHRYPELSAEIDQYAQRKGKAVIGTGINPGFVMDTLPLVASTVTDGITRIQIKRHVDASKRRVPLQQKVGIGKTVKAFEELAKDNAIGHVGLEESLRMLAAVLALRSKTLTHHYNLFYLSKNCLFLGLTWKLEMSQGSFRRVQSQKKEHSNNKWQQVRLKTQFLSKGMIHVQLLIPNGIFGDTATASMIVNVGKSLAWQEQVGLVTMMDGGLPRYRYKG